jgi:hypothetical protein
MLGHRRVDGDAGYGNDQSRCLDLSAGLRLHGRGTAYNKSEADEPVDGGAISGVDRRVFGLGAPLVNEAVEKQDYDAVDDKAEELQSGYEGGRRGRGGADVGGAEGAGPQRDEEAADGQQQRGQDVARRAVQEEVDEAVAVRGGRRVGAPGGRVAGAGVAKAVEEGEDEREECLRV